MGKAKKVKVSHGETKTPKIGLAEQIEEASSVKLKDRHKVRFRKDEDEEFVDSKTTQKILSQARKQQQEIAEEEGPSSGKFKKPITKLGDDDSEDDLSEEEDVHGGSEYYEDFEINEEDERALNMFMDHSRQPMRTLADIIMQKLTEKKTEIETQFTDNGSVQMQELDPKVKKALYLVRDILIRYRSGRLPKLFNSIPSFKNWEQLLYATEPIRWSAAAMYHATRLFSSKNEKMAQRFYNLVLLPRIRDDLAEYKRLNFHLYQALKKALRQPGAFFKGIIIPLLDSGNCTLREAIIVGSVMIKMSIPVLHSAAAMLKIAEMDYTGANSIFLRILIDKKYALPFRVVDGVVHHFIRFQRDQRELPVLWHQAFLTFVQRYKSDVSMEQKQALLELLKYQRHHTITSEIRRELQHAECRDGEVDVPMDERHFDKEWDAPMVETFAGKDMDADMMERFFNSHGCS